MTELRKRLSKPIRRTEKDINWALGIAGIGEGPEDLSENMRAYDRHFVQASQQYGFSLIRD